MSAAWEMHLRGDWLAPLTVNFQPYHHTPPLLFWLINIAWSVFGVSRWAGTIPMLLSATACIFLTKRLAGVLFPGYPRISDNIPLLMVGSLPFLVYSLLVMFDVTLMVFILLSLLALLSFSRSGNFKYLLWLALAMGLGVLTKGPVAWLYVIFPILSGPLWRPQKMSPLKWYGGCFTALILSIIPVLFWLVPVLSQSSGKFAYWLVWEQTAGRVTGSFGDAHVRPVWFYLPLLPVLFLPWLFFPSFWSGLKQLKQHYADEWAVRFLLLWIVPVFIAFSLIGGKQPHYLVPLLPGILILSGLWLNVPRKRIVLITVSLVCALFIGQAVASKTFFTKYDLRPVADYVRSHEEHDWAFVRKYQGQLTFLGGLKKPVDDEQMSTIDQWFKEHPGQAGRYSL
ncbi:MAG: glycosyltransferase family 39 protein [Alphaproteobacteria bacterium]